MKQLRYKEIEFTIAKLQDLGLYSMIEPLRKLQQAYDKVNGRRPCTMTFERGVEYGLEKAILILIENIGDIVQKQ